MDKTAPQNYSKIQLIQLRIFPWVVFPLMLLFATHFSISGNPQQPFQLEMSKKSSKNGKHANLKAREKAAEEYEKAKAEYLEKLRQPNKSAEDKKNLGKLRKKLERLRKKKDFTGENHSQNKKGN